MSMDNRHCPDCGGSNGLHYSDCIYDGTYLETIITKNGVNMPFSVYGDGIKKYYDILFPVVFALASKLNVQLFIVTHSIEAILRYGNYENNNSKNDPIKVITLKKLSQIKVRIVI